MTRPYRALIRPVSGHRPRSAHEPPLIIMRRTRHRDTMTCTCRVPSVMYFAFMRCRLQAGACRGVGMATRRPGSITGTRLSPRVRCARDQGKTRSVMRRRRRLRRRKTIRECLMRHVLRRCDLRQRMLRPCTARLPCPGRRRPTRFSHRLRMPAACIVWRSMTRTSRMRMACVSTSMRATRTPKVGRPCRTERTRTTHMPACRISTHPRRHRCRTRTPPQGTIDRVTRK